LISDFRFLIRDWQAAGRFAVLIVNKSHGISNKNYLKKLFQAEIGNQRQMVRRDERERDAMCKGVFNFQMIVVINMVTPVF
jgi:hypothetical protein